MDLQRPDAVIFGLYGTLIRSNVNSPKTEEDFRNVSYYPETIETLIELQNLRIKSAVVGRLGPESKVGVDVLGLTQFVDEISYCCDAELEKNDSQVYLNMADKLGFNPENILIVGSRPHPEVYQPRQKGFTTKLVDRVGRFSDSLGNLSSVPTIGVDPAKNLAYVKRIATKANYCQRRRSTKLRR